MYVDDVIMIGSDTKLISQLVVSLDKCFALKDLGLSKLFPTNSGSLPA